MNKSRKPSEITEETINILREGQYGPKEQRVKLDLKRVHKCKTYSSIPTIPTIPTILTVPTVLNADKVAQIMVLGMDTFEAGIWLKQQKGAKNPVVLDFASDSNPGGGYRTNQEGTQEESLCRKSVV